jgi:hypothetical protein
VQSTFPSADRRSLQRCLGINLLSDRITSDAIHISSGTAPLDGRSPHPEARMPKRDWRPLSGAERELLFSEGPYRVKRAVSLLDVDAAVLEQARGLLLPILLQGATSEDERSDITAARRNAICAARDRILEQAMCRRGIVPSAVGAANLVLHLPRQPSTAYVYDADVFMGLHIDNHGGHGFDQRERAHVLTAWNLGFAERYLNFVNLDVRRMLDLVVGSGLPQPDTIYQLRSAFFDAFPDYPVLRATLQPGQGYLCNTQDLLHDGATNFADMPDIALLIAFDLEDATRQSQ